MIVVSLIMSACGPAAQTPQVNEIPVPGTAVNIATPDAVSVLVQNGVPTTTPLAPPFKIEAVPVPEPFPTLTVEFFNNVDVRKTLQELGQQLSFQFQPGVYDASFHLDGPCPGLSDFRTAKNIVDNALGSRSFFYKVIGSTAMAFLDKLFGDMSNQNVDLEAVVISADQSAIGIWFKTVEGRQILVLIGSGFPEKYGTIIPVDTNIITIWGQKLSEVVNFFLADIADGSKQVYFTGAALGLLGGAVSGYISLDTHPDTLARLKNFVSDYGKCLSLALQQRRDYKKSDNSKNSEYALANVNGVYAFNSQADAVDAAKVAAAATTTGVVVFIAVEIVGVSTGNIWVLAVPIP